VGIRIDGRRDISNRRVEDAARIGQHADANILADLDVGDVALADIGDEPDRGQIADGENWIGGDGLDVLADADFARNHRAADGRFYGRLWIDGRGRLEDRDFFVCPA